MKKTIIYSLSIIILGFIFSSNLPAWSNDDNTATQSSNPQNKIYIAALPYSLILQDRSMSVFSTQDKNVGIVLINQETGEEESANVHLMLGENKVLSNIPEGEYTVIISDDEDGIYVPNLLIE